MIGFFTIFGAKRNLNEWVTHGMCMHAMWVTHGKMHASCGGVQPIKRRSVEEKRWRNRRKEERKREMREDPVASSFDF